jgi:hypothetical protein
MNYITFDDVVEPADTFFVGFELSNVNANDTFAIYQSLRTGDGAANHFYYKQNGTWYNFKESNSEGYSIVNVMELVACNVSGLTDTPIVNMPVNVLIYPNPTNSELTVESDDEIQTESISVYNMLGQKINVTMSAIDSYHFKINLSGNRPGVYFVRFNYANTFITRKFSFVPH